MSPQIVLHDIGKENRLHGLWNQQQSDVGDIKIKELKDDSLFLAARSISERLSTSRSPFVASDAFNRVADVHVGQYVQVLSSFREACKACSSCGDYDSKILRQLIGKVVRISLIDASDNSVQVEVADEQAFPFNPFQWIAVKALCPASSWLALCNAGRPKEALEAIPHGDSVELETVKFAAAKWVQEWSPSRRQHWHAIGCRNERWCELVLKEVAKHLGSADFVAGAAREHLQMARQAIEQGYVVADVWIENVCKAIAAENDPHYRILLHKLGMLHPDWHDLKQKIKESRRQEPKKDTTKTGKTRYRRQQVSVSGIAAVQVVSRRFPSRFFGGLVAIGGMACFLIRGHARQKIAHYSSIGGPKDVFDTMLMMLGIGWSLVHKHGQGLISSNFHDPT